MTRPSWRAGLLCAAASCCPQADAPKVATTPQATATVAPAEAPPQPVQYVVRAPGRSSTSARFELERGQTGLLVRGERWVVDGRGAPLATHPGSNLVRAERLEEGAGSGFLFIGSAGLFTSPTFDGPLKELATGDFSSVSLGPGFVLASRNDGGARAFDLATGKPRAGLPIGTVLVRTAKDGSAGAITHGGRAYLSVDRAASWRDVTTDVGSPVDLEASEGVLYYIDAAGDAARLEGGSLVRSPAPARPQPKHDPDWSKNESPLEYAVNRGALLEDGRAVEVDGGTIVEISLGTGKIVAREPGALPPQGNCVPQSAGQRILFVCSQSDTSSVFSRPKKGGALKLDKTFGLRGTFLRGRGEALLFVGPCKDSAQKAGVACARTRDGEWVEVDRSAELADTPPGEPLKVIGWAPREGGAYLVVGGKSGGLWDAKTGAKTRLDEDAQKKLEGLFSQSTSSSKPISDRVAVDDQGAIIGLSKDNVGFRVTDGGKQVERSPFRFSQVSSAGNLVLAFDSATGSLWQSSDWGWSYVEVDGPPDPTNTKDTPRACSEAGCAFGQWLRLGWEVVAPSPKAPPKPSSPSLAGTPPKLPQLKCTVSGKATTKELDSPENRLGFGAESHKREGVFLNLFGRSINAPGYGSLDSSALRAAITGKAGFFDTPLPPASLMQSERKIRFVEPFDPKGGVRQSSIKVSELFEAARLSNAPPPDLMATDDRGLAVITLSEPPGVLLTASLGALGPTLWARGKEKPLAIGIVDDQMSPVSAVQVGPEELAVLMTSWDSGVVVRSLGRGRSNELFSIPRLPDAVTSTFQADALALGPDNKLGVIRIQGSGPPTKDDPALLLRPNEAPVALAPWSALELDGSAACASMTGHRAIVQLRGPWLTPGMTADVWGREIPSYLRVRWSATQVCLEAAEVHAVSHQSGNGTSYDVALVARFGKDAGAGLVLVGEGAELREPRTCELLR
ncbi:MAG: hypothetical protein IPM79_38265 [Polyangiaceae bacterium]|nr:hypothetical protein [Polyangiaceae bacterium]